MGHGGTSYTGSLNQILRTGNSLSDVPTGIHISPPYREIIHDLCGVQTTTKWFRHGQRGYHNSYP